MFDYNALVHEAYFVSFNFDRPSAAHIKKELIAQLELLSPLQINTVRTIAEHHSPLHVDALEEILADLPKKAVNTELFNICAQQLDEAKKKLAEQQAIVAELTKQLLEVTDGKAVISSLYSYTYVERKGAVNYAAIPELHGVNVDKYRKEPVKVWSLTKLEE